MSSGIIVQSSGMDTVRGVVTDIEMFHPIEGYEFSYQSALYNNFTLDTHSHTFCEIIYIQEGTGRHHIDGYTIEMNPGNLFVLNEGVTHGMSQTENLRFINLMFRRDGMFRFSRDIRKSAAFHTLFEIPPGYYRSSPLQRPHPEYVQCKNQHKENIEKMLSNIHDELEARLPAFESKILALFMELVVLICRTFEASSSWDKNVTWAAAQAAAWLEREFSRNITLEDLCSIAGVQKSALYEQFQRYYGTSPFGYLAEIRLNAAARLLEWGEKPIKQIAAQCGFEDVNYFTRCFRRRFGTPPGRYRKNA